MTKTLNEALFKLQGMIRGVKKDSKNPHFKNSYASLEQVSDTIRPHMQELGLFWMQWPGKVVDGSIEVTTRISHVGGEFIEFTMEMPMAKRDPQGAGSALTYAMRYSLMAALGLPPTDDDAETAIDRNNARPEPDMSGTAAARKDAKVIENLWAEIIELKSERALASFWKDNVKTILGMDEVSRKRFVDKKDELKAKFAGNVVNDIQDTFPGSQIVDERNHPLNAG